MESAVVTFDRHPAAVVRPESAPRLLTDLEQKLELLAATGLDRCLVIAFDEARSKEPAEEFVREVLVDCLGATVVIVGEDFHFGHQRRGNVELLERWARSSGSRSRAWRWSTPPGGPADDGDAGVVDGDPPRAGRGRPRAGRHAMLGRPHEVRGIVAHGDAAGPRARVPDRQRVGARRHPAPRRRDLRRLVRAPRRRACTRRPSRSVAGRRSTRRPTPACSRPTSSTSTGTSTASAARVRFVDAPAGRGAVRRRRGPGRADPRGTATTARGDPRPDRRD